MKFWVEILIESESEDGELASRGVLQPDPFPSRFTVKQAIAWSAKKWLVIADFHRDHPEVFSAVWNCGNFSCALCEKFDQEDTCERSGRRCPIFKHTGRDSCAYTPFGDYINAQNQKDLRSHALSMYNLLNLIYQEEENKK